MTTISLLSNSMACFQGKNDNWWGEFVNNVTELEKKTELNLLKEKYLTVFWWNETQTPKIYELSPLHFKYLTSAEENQLEFFSRVFLDHQIYFSSSLPHTATWFNDIPLEAFFFLLRKPLWDEN